MSKKTISTFAKFMICPPSLKKSQIGLGEQGLNDFNTYKYRHASQRNKSDSTYTQDLLLKNLTEAISRTCDDLKKPLLLLSDGKDSLSLAIAFSEKKISCDTLTLLRRDDQEMKSYITEVAKKLGHRPFFITVDDIVNNFDKDTFISSFKMAENPILDQGYIFFLFGLKLFFEVNNFNPTEYEVIDGLGNDEYLGYLMSKSQWYSYLLSMTGLWKLIPNSLKSLKWYIRSPAESHGDLSTLSIFFNIPLANDLNEYFSLIPKSVKETTYLDFRAFSRGSFHDHQCMMGKTRLASRYLGTKCIYPWVDEELSDYCFNIPSEEKYEFKKIINKLPLREMLINKLNWNSNKRGVDLFFDLEQKTFIESVIGDVVPEDLIYKITNNKTVNAGVKKRAYLELLNFYGYCIANNISDEEIRDILQ